MDQGRPEYGDLMRKVLWVGFALLLAVGSMLPAHAAANAEFQGNCTNTPGTPLTTSCVFSATRTPSSGSPTSCSPSYISNYFWDYGDGADSGFTTNSSASHVYTGADDWDVCLSVFCGNGTSDTTCHCMINYIGIYGCILPGTGWGPP
jgi:PKD domain